MARYFGAVGYVEEQETPPDSGVWQAVATERMYKGDVKRSAQRPESSDKVNSDIVVQNELSIVADAYANEHYFAIRYARWAGAYWTITSVEVQRPRLILRMGGVYNGPKAEAP